MAAAGYKLGWVQLWGSTPQGNGPNHDAAYQLEQIRLAGMLTGGYIVLYPDTTDETAILCQVALDAAGPERGVLSFVAPDIEPSSPLRMERLVNLRMNIKNQTGGILTPIYTSREYYRRAFGSADVVYPFAGEDPLLEARYVLNSGSAPDAPPDLDWKWMAFGGWSSRAMLQYAGTTPTCGVGTDRNVFDYGRMHLAPVTPPTPEGGHDLVTAEYDDLLNRINGLAGTVNAHIASPHNVATPPAPAPAPATRTYTVVSGDSLSLIAQKTLNDASRWPEIARLNGIAAPYVIYPGQNLRIP
jgi:hypothetical protein